MSTRSTNHRAGRLIARALIFLAVGVVMNIAVAWGLAAWLPHSGWQAEYVHCKETTDDSFVLFMTNYHTVGACRRTWERIYSGSEIPFLPFSPAIDNSPVIYDLSEHPPLRGIGWGHAEAVRSFPEGFAKHGCEHATGWPLLTAWCGWTFDWKVQPRKYVLEGGIPISGLAQGGFPAIDASELRALPLRPIWSGVTVNTIFYAAIAWGVWQGPSTIRHARCRARGQCVRCRYDLAGLAPTTACPECGLARRVNGVTT